MNGLLEMLEKANKPVQVVTATGPVEVPVPPELNQVEPESARGDNPPKLKVFVSYAHEDYKLWEHLKPHLDVLKNENLVKWWFDGKIRDGSDWDDAIRSELKEADIIIFLVSTPLFASSYIRGVEMKEAHRRYQSGEAEILPVVLEPTLALKKHLWLKKLQAVPSVEGALRPITTFTPRRNGWARVEGALREVIGDVIEKKQRKR